VRGPDNGLVRTVGVEEELLVVDRESGSPTTASDTVIRRAPWRLEEAGAGDTARGGDQPGGHVGHELQQEQVEIDTPPRTAAEDLDRDLLAWRRAAARSAGEVGAFIVATGTSPLPVTPHLTPDPRYGRMRQSFGITAEQQLTCGSHVHVGVTSDEEGVAVIDRIRGWLPGLLALSANSPFWQGQDTGYASYRSQAWLRWPSAGPTDRFGSAADYHRLVRDMVGSGVLLDQGMVYFDARLSASYPTVEVRVGDVCLHAQDTVLLAVLCRALVETAARAWERGEEAPPIPTSMIRLAMWRAGRDGVDGELLDTMSGRPGAAHEVLERLVSHVRPALEDAGDLELVRHRMREVLRRGNGARRQRAVLERTGSLEAVVLDLAGATTRC
jgi:glutamate---cysteine ligase / carboxylate-amine ligase